MKENDLNEVIRKWKVQLEAYRDEKDFLIKHNFKIETLSLEHLITALWNVIRDMEDCSRGKPIHGGALGEGEA